MGLSYLFLENAAVVVILSIAIIGGARLRCADR